MTLRLLCSVATLAYVGPLSPSSGATITIPSTAAGQRVGVYVTGYNRLRATGGPITLPQIHSVSYGPASNPDRFACTELDVGVADGAGRQVCPSILVA